MTTLRRYIFGFFAACVALAVGIAIGNGPLQHHSSQHDNVSLADANARLATTIRDLRREQAFSQAVGQAAGPALLHDRLTNTAVALFVLPGVRPSTVDGVVKAISAAGGELTVRAHIGAGLIDPGRKTYVDSVGTASLRGLTDIRTAASASPYTRIGMLMARAYTGPSDSLAVDDEATEIDAQLEGARLLALRTPLQRRASAVVVLAPGDHGPSDGVYARHQIELQLVDALAGHCDGLLVASSTSSSEPRGLVAEIAGRRTMAHTVSTLDVVDTPAGQLAVVPSLTADIAGHPGAYGVSGSAVTLPPGLAPRR
jgi:hypothetical protein